MSVSAVPDSDPPPLVEPLYEPGRRGRWVAPVLLALAGLCAIQVIVLRSFVLPQSAAKGDFANAATLRTVANAAAVCFAAFAVAGVALGARGMRPIQPVFRSDFTTAVIVLATLAGLSVPALMFVTWQLSRIATPGEPDRSPVLHYVMTPFGVAVLGLLGVLRLRRVRLAAVFTPALALLLVLMAPVGTAIAVTWFVAIRKRETSAI